MGWIWNSGCSWFDGALVDDDFSNLFKLCKMVAHNNYFRHDGLPIQG